MKKILWIVLVVGIFSCSENKPKIENIESENLTTKQIDSILTEFNFQYESPIVLDSTNQVLIPISTELLERRTKYSSDGYYSDDYPRYWNVLFYNRETGKNQLLTQKKIRISQIHAIRDEYDGENKIMNSKVLYEIGEKDYNDDGKLNGKDPEYLFCSEIDGSNLIRISPKNEDLRFFKVIPKSNQILIRTIRDTERDSIFNNEDESILYKAELENQKWKLDEIIDSKGRKNIENLYFEQWLKTKK